MHLGKKWESKGTWNWARCQVVVRTGRNYKLNKACLWRTLRSFQGQLVKVSILSSEYTRWGKVKMVHRLGEHILWTKDTWELINHKSINFAIRKSGFQFWPYHFLFLWPCEYKSTFLNYTQKWNGSNTRLLRTIARMKWDNKYKVSGT